MKVYELLDALLNSQSITTIEHEPAFDPSHMEDNEVFEKFVEIIGSAQSIKHFDLRNIEEVAYASIKVSVNISQTLAQGKISRNLR